MESQLKSATGTAEAALDAGISAASDAVRAGVSAASRESDAVKSRLTQFYETGLAHYEATEQQALDAVKQGIRFVKHEHPQASMAAGVAAFFVLLPGPRRFLFRQTIGRWAQGLANTAADDTYSLRLQYWWTPACPTWLSLLSCAAHAC